MLCAPVRSRAPSAVANCLSLLHDRSRHPLHRLWRRRVRLPVLRRVVSAHVDVRVRGVLLELQPALPVDEVASRGSETPILLRAEDPDVARVEMWSFGFVVLATLAASLPRLLDVGASPLYRVPVVVRSVPLVALGAHLPRFTLLCALLILLEEPVYLLRAAIGVPHRAGLLGSLPRVQPVSGLHVLFQGDVFSLTTASATQPAQREDRRQRHQPSHRK